MSMGQDGLEAGPPSMEEAVVFVHGNPGSSRDWEALVERAGEFGRAVAFAMPGFGRAGRPDGFDHSVAGYARHLEAAVQQLGIRHVHLVLHDFAGPWGLTWAAAHPESFASVTLVNTGLLLDYRWHLLARVWRTPGLGELFQATTTRAGFHLVLRRGPPRVVLHWRSTFLASTHRSAQALGLHPGSHARGDRDGHLHLAHCRPRRRHRELRWHRATGGHHTACPDGCSPGSGELTASQQAE